MKNYILDYYQKIQDGSIVVGFWVLAFYKLIIERIEQGVYAFDKKKADKAIEFIENFVHHSEGRSDLLKLELWQKAIVSVIFGILDKDGNRQFREVFIVVGRKNGKSLLAAAIIAYCVYLDGEYGAKVYCVAPKLDQADLVYNAFRNIVEMDPELDAMTKSRKSDLYVAESKSSIKKIAFNYKKADGFNPHLTVCDEISSWQGEQGLRQYDVMKSALGARRQPLLLSISTAGYVNDGIYDELMKRATRFLKGDSKETRLAPFLYLVDEPDKWNDINELQKSLPNLGVSVSVDYMLEEIAIAEGSLSKKAEFLTKYCNIKQNSSSAWLDTKDIEKCCGKHIEPKDLAHNYAVAGIDLSRTTDLTFATCIVEKDGVLNVLAKAYLPAEKLEEATARDGVPYNIYVQRGLLELSGDNFIDYNDCYKWLVSLVEEYEILPLMVGYDRYSAQYLIKDLEEYGFKTDDVYQGYNLTPVIQEAEGIIKDGRLNIGDNDLLKIHMLDTALKADNENNKTKIVKLAQTSHIDGMAALLDALCVRQKWWNELGGQLENKG